MSPIDAYGNITQKINILICLCVKMTSIKY